ncbi:MAG: nicotinate (nicotinamide) nucleotide adenylyltransferase [Campylobacterota bacterium]|nr:nicotinate (nicotinamide) nucleotide adenylyltransferase [Campylobacterota bacterium]
MTTTNKNIAIFGGSFDPIHIGHESIINKSLKILDIDKLIVVPTFLNPFKNRYHLEPTIRYQLIKELFSDNQHIEVSNFEILRDEATPSIITVNYFKKLYNPKKIYLIIGSDNIKKLDLWQDFNKLKELVSFVVITRERYEVKNDIIQFTNIKLDMPISSTQLRKNLNMDLIPKKIQQKVKQVWKKE